MRHLNAYNNITEHNNDKGKSILNSVSYIRNEDRLIYSGYPAYDAMGGLKLWYDFSGRTNLDVKKGIAEDLSGNGNDGILKNFAYESGSGYDSNSYLEFDNVDDFITIPELNLDVNNFTVAVDGEVLSYRGDNVAKINENGLEIGGRNLADWNNIIKQGAYTHLVGNRYLLNPKAINHGFKPKTDKLNVGDYGVLSYKIKYISGLLINFGGHCSQTVLKISIDGNIISRPNYHTGLSKSYIEDGEEHLVELYFKKNSTIPANAHIGIELNRYYFDPFDSFFEVWDIKLEKGSIPTDWTPAPEDFQKTKIAPIFSNKIKTLMYWNRALTDTELQEVYNVQKHRI